MMSSPGANDVELRLPRPTTRGGADKVQFHHDASAVLGARPSALDAASKRGSEKDSRWVPGSKRICRYLVADLDVFSDFTSNQRYSR